MTLPIKNTISPSCCLGEKMAQPKFIPHERLCLRGQSEGEKIFIGDEIISVFGPTETTYLNSDFVELGLELEAKTKTIEDVKDMFYYLDALV